MKTAVRYSYNDPSIPYIQEKPKPIPLNNEVLIRVYATTVNRTDCAILRARPGIMRLFLGLRRPRSPFLGTDFSGVVEAVGEDITDLKISDKVWGFGDNGIHTQAEYVCLSEKTAIEKIPEGSSFKEIVACAEGAHYAINMLNKVQHKPGQRALVNGASGAIGSAMVQLLKHYKIDTTATCRRMHFDQIRSLGADQLIDYTEEEFTDRSETYDFVFDTVGKSTFGKCKKILNRKGVYISSELGPNAQNIWYSLYTPFFGRKKVKFPLPLHIEKSLALIKELVAKNEFTPLIDRIYPLDEIKEAYAYVASGQKLGNVVITME